MALRTYPHHRSYFFPPYYRQKRGCQEKREYQERRKYFCNRPNVMFYDLPRHEVSRAHSAGHYNRERRPRLILKEDRQYKGKPPHDNDTQTVLPSTKAPNNDDIHAVLPSTKTPNFGDIYDDFMNTFFTQSDENLDEFMSLMELCVSDEKYTKTKQFMFCSALRFGKVDVVKHFIDSKYHHTFDQRDGKYCITLPRCDVSDDIQNKLSSIFEENRIHLQFD